MLPRFVLAFLASFILVPAAASAQVTTNIVLTTDLGDIVVALETERAPVTAHNIFR